MTLYQGYTAEQLAVEYSPSSCIDDINVYIRQYIKQSEEATTRAINNFSLRANIPYGQQPSQRLDLYLPTTKAQRKLHVYIHGGYWQELSKTESSFAATNFQAHGVHFAVLNYTLAPNARLSDIVTECKQAIQYLIHQAKELGFDADEVYLSGSSAGAHLATMVALDNAINIKGICAVSGIYDLTPIQHTYINAPLQLDNNEIQANSPIFQVSKWQKKCSILLAYGDNETSEFKRQSNAFYQELLTKHCAVTTFEIPDRNHFDVILDLTKSNSSLFARVAQQMSLVQI